MADRSLFDESGNLLAAPFDADAWQSLEFARGYACRTETGFLRAHHLFLGILRQGGAQLRRWLSGLGSERESLLESWEELFGAFPGHRHKVFPKFAREFFADDLLKCLRDGWNRAVRKGRPAIDVSGLVVCLLSQGDGLVPGCFERSGISPDWLVLHWERVEKEHGHPCGEKGPRGLPADRNRADTPSD